MMRAGIAALVGLETEVEVVAEVSTPDPAVSVTESFSPDVVLTDLQFDVTGEPGRAVSGADATRRIRALEAALYGIVLANYDLDVDNLGAVEAGASGYFLKDAPPYGLLRS